VSPNIAHIPAFKQRELHTLVQILRDAADVEHIILFGSHARGDFVEDYANGYISDFDTLVLVADEELAEDLDVWFACRDRAYRLLSTPVSIIVHTVADVNARITRGNSFFRDAVSEGIALYDAGRVAIAEVKPLTPEQHRALATESLPRYLDDADGFLAGFEYGVKHHRLSLAAYYLHQAAETIYKLVLVVFTAYRPKTHDLTVLGQRVAAVAPELGPVVPPKEPGSQRLFALLCGGYVDARYDHEYAITAEELGILGRCVADLRKRAERVCSARIAAMVTTVRG
jgi:HEPN domain-containing protein/predicted nucleotidyltransferase